MEREGADQWERRGGRKDGGKGDTQSFHQKENNILRKGNLSIRRGQLTQFFAERGHGEEGRKI